MSRLEYRYPVDALYTGSSLGNIHAFARLSAATDLLGLWSPADNQFYAGEWTVRMLAGGVPLSPVETVIAPACQTTHLHSETVDAEQSFFLPVISGNDGEESAEKQHCAVFLITLRCSGTGPTSCVLRHSITFPGVVTDRFTKQPSEQQCGKQVHVHRHGHFCTITTVGRMEEVRVFGSEIPWTSCTSDSSTLNAVYELVLQPGEVREISFLLAFSPVGSEAALNTFKKSGKGDLIRARATETIGEILSRAQVFTPNAVVNRGMQWAKVCMGRVRHAYRSGEAFTNDPPQDIVVIRDLAWFALGSDYVLPDFSRTLLKGAVKHGVHDGGKLTEYYHADERKPALHDYHLNINDDTPLFLWALAHHCQTSDDHRLLGEFYQVMRRGCDWILRQIRDGLVWCHARGTNVWGISSWRNVIDDYTLSGAVTEINAECYLALMVTADAARRVGRGDDADRFEAAAAALKKEINSTLRSEKTGLYLLNIDNDGIRHHDITGDQIFPVLAGAADMEMRDRVLERLARPDVWTPYGARTVSPAEPNFDPEAGYQLIGGIWPNLTAWIAYCLRSSRPEKVEEALVNIYKIAEVERPASFAFVVPGEFPERLHGTGFQSRGMTLSPWTPPTYFWLGIEGLLGVRCTWDDITLNPTMPPDWRWIAVKNLHLVGRPLTAFLHEGTLYASRPLTSAHPLRIGTELRTESDDEGIFTAGLLIDGDALLFAASDEGAEGTVRIVHGDHCAERKVALAPGESILFTIFPNNSEGTT